MIDKPEVVAWAMASEGSFSIQRVRNSLQPKISINNTDEIYLDKFISLVGFGHIGKHINTREDRNWKPIYHWYISSFADCLKFCESVIDYMPIKQRQVELVMEFCKRGIGRYSNNHRLPIEEKDWLIYDELRFIGKRGTNDY